MPPGDIAACLNTHRAAIVENWISEADAIYPFETAGFLRSRQDKFANPVGDRTRRMAEGLMDALMGTDGPQAEALDPLLEEFLRVRAVQDISPDAALAVFFRIKPLIRQALFSSGLLEEAANLPALTRMDERADSVALRAFAIYSRLREELFALRLADMKRRSDVLLRLARERGEDTSQTD